MKKLSNTQAGLKKRVGYKKTCICLLILNIHTCEHYTIDLKQNNILVLNNVLVLISFLK